MCSLSGPWDLAGKYPVVRRIILDQAEEELPDGIELGFGLYMGPRVRITGPQLKIDLSEGTWRWIMELAYPPFAFLLVLASNVDNPGLGLMMNDWGKYSPTEAKAFEGFVEVGFGWTPYPGDYRSSASIEAT